MCQIDKDRMKQVRYQKSKLYTSMHDFFRLGGDVNMRLTREAAIDICRHAKDYDILIWRIEGGIWHNLGFQPWIDALWDSQYDPPVLEKNAILNNLLAMENIIEEDVQYNAFILTVTNYCGLSKDYLYDKYFEKHPIIS